MNLDRFIIEVRPTGGVFNLADVRPGGSRVDELIRCAVGLCDKPVIVVGAGTQDTSLFLEIAGQLAYGSAAVLRNVANLEHVNGVAALADFREWHKGPDFPGLPMGAYTWIKSHWESSYETHQPYLLEAVKRTTGNVLELGSGDGSTPVLHELCAAADKLLVTVDSDAGWLAKYTHLASDRHLFEHLAFPASTRWLDEPWGVVFVDHAPGNNRYAAIERACSVAEYVVCHDTETLGYGLEDLLNSCKYRKDFRYARPWTTVVSDCREIW